TYLVHDNQVYALTKGQASPTSDQGFITKTTPHGAAPPINPIALAIIAGASLVGRGFAGDIEHLTNLIKAGITHKGFALIDILQPCVSFNHVNTFSWYRERVYKVDEEAGYDPTNRTLALTKAQEWGERIPIGIIYQTDRPTYEEQIPALNKGPLVRQKIEPGRGQVEKLMDELL
ncbi:MAG: thiamine pyrophosphate-dependent enzyme, partial [Chloroflexota bacterium]